MRPPECSRSLRTLQFGPDSCRRAPSSGAVAGTPAKRGFLFAVRDCCRTRSAYCSPATEKSHADRTVLRRFHHVGAQRRRWKPIPLRAAMARRPPGQAWQRLSNHRRRTRLAHGRDRVLGHAASKRSRDAETDPGIACAARLGDHPARHERLRANVSSQRGRNCVRSHRDALGHREVGRRAEGAAPQVLLVSPPHFGKFAPFMELFYRGAEETNRALASAYATVAESSRARFLDAATVVPPSPVDGVHPDANGHRELAEAIAKLVAS